MKKENKKLIWSIVAVALIIVLVGGGTYAYWSWASATNTNVTFTVTGGTLTIDGGGNITTKTLAPAMCNNTNYAIQRKIKVTASNDTTTDMVETIQLKVSELAVATNHEELTPTNKAYIKWALVRSDADQHAASTWLLTSCPTSTVATTSETKGTVLASNNFGSISKDSVITLYSSDKATKKASPSASAVSTIYYYELYIWIDSGYTGTASSGTNATDALQGLTLNLVWQGSMTNEIS